jgi:hypothetical protein
MAGCEILAGIFTQMGPETVELMTVGTLITNLITGITVNIAPIPIRVMDAG